MSTSFSNTETCPCNDGSLSQLFRIAQNKLQDIVGKRTAISVDQSQADDLERDALEVLRLVRSIKNSLAPINRIPPEVLSLIPDYCGGGDADEDLIALTHVCRDWRDIFISRSSLWTRLDFRNMDKTRTYIQRSQSCPLDIHLDDDCEVTDGEFALICPHTHRLKSFTLDAYFLPSFLTHLRCHVPLLEELDIDMGIHNRRVLDEALFNGDLSSLRQLRLYGIVLPLPWKHLENLRSLTIDSASQTCGMPQILDFLESSPLVESVRLRFLILYLGDLPPERIVPLRHLKNFSIKTETPHSDFLHHLQISAGAKLISEFCFDDDDSPLPPYLPERLPNLSNLSHINTINLLFEERRKSIRLSGPSGSLHVRVHWDNSPLYTRDHQILRSLGHPILSTIKTLVVSENKHPTPGRIEECPIFHALSSANKLRTLISIQCNNEPFIRALDPERNPSNLLLCPNMKQLSLYVYYPRTFDVEPSITRMLKNRASRGAKLSSVTFSDLGEKEVLELREHVEHVECGIAGWRHHWDYVPGEGTDER